MNKLSGKTIRILKNVGVLLCGLMALIGLIMIFVFPKGNVLLLVGLMLMIIGIFAIPFADLIASLFSKKSTKD